MDKEKNELAEVDYMKGMKYQEIADKYNVSINTVKSWKTRYSWNKKGAKSVQPKEKKVCTQIKSKKGADKKAKDAIPKEVKELMQNDELKDEHKKFCVIYAKRQNATKAYQMVYHCTYETAMVKGSLLVRNVKIREQIDRLLEADLNKEFLKRGLIQQYKDIAFSDISDYLEFGKRQIPQWSKNSDGVDIAIVDPNTGQQLIREYSYVDLKDSVGVDTSLISEVSEGKNGIKFKLADKMKAMEVLAKLSDLLSDEEKTKLDLEYKKLNNRKLAAEITKMSGPDETETESDGFIDALDGKAEEDWKE